jgi:hypothetical protein
MGDLVLGQPPRKSKVRCPHCGLWVLAEPAWVALGVDAVGGLTAYCFLCPNRDCAKLVVALHRMFVPDTLAHGVRSDWTGSRQGNLWLVYPQAGVKPVPAGVPDDIARAFREACAVQPLSPGLSAVGSAYCLQILLEEKEGAGQDDLADQIGCVLKKNTLPRGLAKQVDAVRQLRLFGAHAKRHTETGELVRVTSEEAEWLLDLLAQLLEHYYETVPHQDQQIEAVDQKLGSVGKTARVRQPPDS